MKIYAKSDKSNSLNTIKIEGHDLKFLGYYDLSKIITTVISNKPILVDQLRRDVKDNGDYDRDYNNYRRKGLDIIEDGDSCEVYIPENFPFSIISVGDNSNIDILVKNFSIYTITWQELIRKNYVFTASLSDYGNKLRKLVELNEDLVSMSSLIKYNRILNDIEKIFEVNLSNS